MTTTVSAWDEIRRGVQTDVLSGAADHFARLSWNSGQMRALQRQGLERPRVTARVVDRLDRHPGSGKFRRLAPL